MGTEPQSKAQVLQYLSWGRCNIAKHVTTVTNVLLRRVTFNKQLLHSSNAAIDASVEELEQKLASQTYLVGEMVTLADLFVASCFFSCFSLTLGTQWRRKHTIFMRWFDAIVHTEYLTHVLKQLKFIEIPCPTPKFASRRRKPLHPLEYLGKPEIPLNVWRRVAADFRGRQFHSVAMPYFWNTFYNPRDWSIWGVDCYCPDGVTEDFLNEDLYRYMKRLHFSIKYLYGRIWVYRKGGKLCYCGAFLVRGSDPVPVFDCVSNWKDFHYTKLDPSQPDVRAKIACVWSNFMFFVGPQPCLSGVSL